MIIFLLCFFLLLIFLLFWKFKIKFYITIENTKSHIEIQSIFFHWNKKGKFTLRDKKKTQNNNQEKKENQKESKKKRQIQWRNWFLKNITYDEITIEEKIGLVDPMVTALVIPFLSTITTMPLHFLKVNDQQFHFAITPIYHQLSLIFHLEAKASFQFFYLLKCIVKEKIRKL